MVLQCYHNGTSQWLSYSVIMLVGTISGMKILPRKVGSPQAKVCASLLTLKTRNQRQCDVKWYVPVMVWRYTPGLTVRTSTLFTQTVCWKLEFEGSQDMTADVEVMEEALTLVGPRGASLPMTIVHAASREVRRFGVTERTLMRCNCRWKRWKRRWRRGGEREREKNNRRLVMYITIENWFYTTAKDGGYTILSGYFW